MYYGPSTQIPVAEATPVTNLKSVQPSLPSQAFGGVIDGNGNEPFQRRKNTIWGQRDGSASKVLCYQAWWSEFHPWYPHRSQERWHASVVPVLQWWGEKQTRRSQASWARVCRTAVETRELLPQGGRWEMIPQNYHLTSMAALHSHKHRVIVMIIIVLNSIIWCKYEQPILSLRGVLISTGKISFLLPSPKQEVPEVVWKETLDTEVVELLDRSGGLPLGFLSSHIRAMWSWGFYLSPRRKQHGSSLVFGHEEPKVPQTCHFFNTCSLKTHSQ